jgi:glycosyltransferase involved in cell wall biosynthesis
MRVCHITTVHKPFDTRIFFKECCSLAEAGHEVYLIAAGADTQDRKGVHVIGVPREQGGRLNRMTRTAGEVFKKALALDADIYHFHDPELLRIGLKLKKKGRTVIYDAHEDLPRQVLDKHYIHPLLRKSISFVSETLEDFISGRMDAVVTATPHIRERFSKVNCRSIDINNYPLIDDLPSPAPWDTRKREACYVGGIFRSRGIIELIKALEHADVQLNLAGNYSPESLRQELSEMKGWEKVNEHGFVDRARINEILNVSRIGIVTLHPTRSYLVSLPVKMFEYMAAGIPVIASGFPLWRSIIEEGKCGICVDPLDPGAIAGAITWLLENDKEAREMGENGRKLVLERYNWKAEEKKLLKLYEELWKAK